MQINAEKDVESLGVAVGSDSQYTEEMVYGTDQEKYLGIHGEKKKPKESKGLTLLKIVHINGYSYHTR